MEMIRRTNASAQRVCMIGLLATLTLFQQSAGGTTRSEVPGFTESLPNPAHIPLDGPIHFQARDIVYHVMAGVHLTIRSVDAVLLPTGGEQNVILDDPSSMKVELLSADTSISAVSMTKLLNDYTFPHAHLPMHGLELSFANGEVHFKGKVRKVIDVPFTATATLSVTSSGDMRLHFTNITAAGIFHKGLLDRLGLNISDLAGITNLKSFRVQGDDVYFPIYALFPAPKFAGRLRSAQVEDGSLIQTFGEPRPFAPAPVPAAHYVYFRGGVMQFCRLTMQGVDLELVNKGADEVFELSLRDIFEQTLPGYITNLPDRGMVAHIVSFRDGRAPGAAIR